MTQDRPASPSKVVSQGGGEYLPRYMEFLYSKNRLNVALSCARCLAPLVVSPKLMAIKCHTVEQIELVNTLCWVGEYSKRLEETGQMSRTP